MSEFLYKPGQHIGRVYVQKMGEYNVAWIRCVYHRPAVLLTLVRFGLGSVLLRSDAKRCSMCLGIEND